MTTRPKDAPAPTASTAEVASGLKDASDAIDSAFASVDRAQNSVDAARAHLATISERAKNIDDKAVVIRNWLDAHPDLK